MAQDKTSQMEYYEAPSRFFHIETNKESRSIAAEVGSRVQESHTYCGLGETFYFMETSQSQDSRNVTQRKLYTKCGFRIPSPKPKGLEQISNDLEQARKLKDHKKEMESLANLGMLYEKSDEFPKAIEYSEDSLKIASELGDKQGEAIACRTLGTACRRQGDYGKAEIYHRRQLSICNKIGSKKDQAQAYVGLGYVFMSLGNYYEANKWHGKAMAISSEIGDEDGVLAATGNLGVIQQHLGQYQNALDSYTECLKLSRQLKHRYFEVRCLLNLGTTCFEMGECDKAKNHIQAALSVALEIDDKETIAMAYVHLGNFETLSGNYDKALEYIEKGMQVKNNRGMGSDAYLIKGKVHLLQNDCQKAKYCFSEALNIAKNKGDKRLEVVSFSQLGSMFAQQACSLHNEQGRTAEYKTSLNQGESNLREALKCWEWLFEHIHEQDHFKISFLEVFVEDYNLLAAILSLEGKTQEALEFCERGRARALEDLLILKHGMSKTSLSPSKHGLISYNNIQEIASAFSVIFYSINAYRSMCWVISQANSCDMETPLPDTASFLKIVNDAYSVLNVRGLGLELGLTCEERLITTDKEEQREVPFTRRLIDRSAIRLPSNLERCVYNEKTMQPLDTLYELLIPPVLNELTDEEIVIIPDGPVNTVPFAALKDPKTGTYISETKRIRLAPSLTSLKLLQDSPAVVHGKSGVLIIGNPKVGEVTLIGKTIYVSDLPGAEREAKTIGNLVGAEPILGTEATKDSIKRLLSKGVSLIHIAAHGTLQGEIFLSPSCRDSQSPTPTSTSSLPDEPDYLLTMKDVQESGVRPQLVVLSCCHSGRGEVKADGVIGMTRAFLAAGARAVVASLWAIADNATMVFMEKFYSHLKQKKSASTSLHLAMKDMRRDSRYSEPRFWAPFFLIGDDVTVDI